MIKANKKDNKTAKYTYNTQVIIITKVHNVVKFLNRLQTSDEENLLIPKGSKKNLGVKLGQDRLCSKALLYSLLYTSQYFIYFILPRSLSLPFPPSALHYRLLKHI